MEPRVFGILKDYISEGYTAILRRSWGHTFIMLKKFNLRRSIQPNKKSFKTKNCIWNKKWGFWFLDDFF